MISLEAMGKQSESTRYPQTYSCKTIRYGIAHRIYHLLRRASVLGIPLDEQLREIHKEHMEL